MNKEVDIPEKEKLAQWRKQEAENDLKTCGKRFSEESDKLRFRITKRSLALGLFSAIVAFLLMGIVPWGRNIYTHHQLEKIKVGMSKDEAIQLIGTDHFLGSDILIVDQQNLMLSFLGLWNSPETHSVRFKNGVVESIEQGFIMF